MKKLITFMVVAISVFFIVHACAQEPEPTKASKEPFMVSDMNLFTHGVDACKTFKTEKGQLACLNNVVLWLEFRYYGDISAKDYEESLLKFLYDADQGKIQY